jgi:hypothetical protein
MPYTPERSLPWKSLVTTEDTSDTPAASQGEPEARAKSEKTGWRVVRAERLVTNFGSLLFNVLVSHDGILLAARP